MYRPRSVSVPVLAGFFLVACQTITEELPQPSGPSNVAGGEVPIVVVPIVLPSPTAPAPTPTPAGGGGGGGTPATPAPPSSQGCSLPRGTGSGDEHSCPRQSPSFLREVEAAIDELVRIEPGLFNLNKTSRGCGNCYEVRDWTRYTQRMAQIVTRNGICAHYDGEELAVKNTNSFNDQYDILTADGFIRRQLGAYRTTCYPAWF